MSAVRVVTCDICTLEQPDPSGWFTVRECVVNNWDTVMVESDRERPRGDPEGLQHVCSIGCLSEAVKRTVTKWTRKKKKEIPA